MTHQQANVIARQATLTCFAPLPPKFVRLYAPVPQSLQCTLSVLPAGEAPPFWLVVHLFSARIESSRPVNLTVKRGRLGAPCSGQVGNYFLRGRVSSFSNWLTSSACHGEHWRHILWWMSHHLPFWLFNSFSSSLQRALVHKFSASPLGVFSLFVINFDLFALRWRFSTGGSWSSGLKSTSLTLNIWPLFPQLHQLRAHCPCTLPLLEWLK